MRLKLKEEPREWQKFASVLLVLVLLIGGWLWHRGLLGTGLFIYVSAAVACVAALCWVWPRPFRPVYRVGMTVGFYIGQTMGLVLLTVLFVVLVTPLGLLLRWSGKDLLRLRRSNGESYWVKSSASSRFERQF